MRHELQIDDSKTNPESTKKKQNVLLCLIFSHITVHVHRLSSMSSILAATDLTVNPGMALMSPAPLRGMCTTGGSLRTVPRCVKNVLRCHAATVKYAAQWVAHNSLTVSSCTENVLRCHVATVQCAAQWVAHSGLTVWRCA